MPRPEGIPRLETLTRICLTGPECTGKTRLAEELARRYGTVWVPEFAREYALRVNRPLTLEDVDLIAEGQLAFEERAAPLAEKLLILDTDLISTVVYSRHYYGTVPPWIARAAAARLA
ncbi:MAG TPA: ATP-binding protein, partial [Thermoanaerobaculia bacterium]|nr:ATP-binding protein [Thermoanaerobaculia bacterium]